MIGWREGDTLIAWRKRNDLTQTGAARLIGVSLRTFQSWENAEIKMPKFLWAACYFFEDNGYCAPFSRQAARGSPYERMPSLRFVTALKSENPLSCESALSCESGYYL